MTAIIFFGIISAISIATMMICLGVLTLRSVEKTIVCESTGKDINRTIFFISIITFIISIAGVVITGIWIS